MSEAPRQRAEPSVAQRSTSRCVTFSAPTQAAIISAWRIASIMLEEIVRGRAVDAEAQRRTSSLELAGRTNAGRSTMFEPRNGRRRHSPCQAGDLLGIEMNAMREPDAARHPACLLEQIDRPQAMHLRQNRSSSSVCRDACEAGSRSAWPAALLSIIRSLEIENGEQGARATRICALASDRGTASASARCRQGSSLRPGRRCRAAGRRPSPTGSSSRARRSCACQARAPPRPRCRPRSRGRPDRDNDRRRRWCTRKHELGQREPGRKPQVVSFSRAQIG